LAEATGGEWNVEKRSIERLRREGFERVARGEGEGMEDVLVGAHWSEVEGMDYERCVNVLSASNFIYSSTCSPRDYAPSPSKIRLQNPPSTLSDPQPHPAHSSQYTHSQSPYLRYQSPSLRSQLSSA